MTNIFKMFKTTANGNSPAAEVTHVAPIPTDTSSTPSPSVVAIPNANAATAATTSASEQAMDAMAHDRQCSLTIGEAQAMFTRYLRRPLSQRSLQRYCANATIAAQMISHSQGKEWLLNEPSLVRFIERYPITLTDMPSPTPPPFSIFNDAVAVAPIAAPDTQPVAAPFIPTRPAVVDDADDATDTHIADMAPLVAADEYAHPNDIGETRRMGELLIENARLTAKIEGLERLIATLEIHDERRHEEVKHSRALISKLTDDVRATSAQMLDTMRTMATAGKMLPASNDDRSSSNLRRTRASVE